jgi:hypothetical protein
MLRTVTRKVNVDFAGRDKIARIIPHDRAARIARPESRFAGFFRSVLIEPRLALRQVFLKIVQIDATFGELIIRPEQAGNILAEVTTGVLDEFFDIVRLVTAHGLSAAAAGSCQIPQLRIDVILIGIDLTEFGGAKLAGGCAQLAIGELVLECAAALVKPLERAAQGLGGIITDDFGAG